MPEDQRNDAKRRRLMTPEELALESPVPIEKITDSIFISGITTGAAIRDNKIKYVINLSGLPTEYKADAYGIRDDGKNDPEFFVKILEAIDRNVKEKNTPILIHCQMGVSRSIIITALYLYYSGSYPTFDAALEYVTRMSKTSLPNLDLVDFVKKWVIPLLKR